MLRRKILRLYRAVALMSISSLSILRRKILRLYMFSIIDVKGGYSGDCPPGVFARRGFSRDTFMIAAVCREYDIRVCR